MRFLTILLLISTAICGVALAQSPSPKVIYGADDRIEAADAAAALQPFIDATAIATNTISISANGNETFRLATTPYNDAVVGFSVLPLCPDEPFYGQPTGGNCTAFLIAPDLLATAGHCVNASNCGSSVYIFDFAYNGDGTINTSSIPADNVYFCTEVVARQLTQTGPDWAIVRLDRPVVGRTPMPLSSSNAPVGTDLIVLGHPSGLPMKVAGGAEVKQNSSSDAHLEANLDTYGGNSGSPVLNADTLQVEGILVRGNADYVRRNGENCAVSAQLGDATGSNGNFEDVQKISALFPYIDVETPTPTVAPTPTGNATLTPTPTPPTTTTPTPSGTTTPTPTPGPSATPSPTATASPTASISPTPTATPIPAPATAIFTFDDQDSEGWTFFSPLTSEQAFGARGDGLLEITSAGNTESLGWWQFSPLHLVPEGGTNPAGQRGLQAETGTGGVFRVTWTVETDRTESSAVPPIRFRAATFDNSYVNEMWVVGRKMTDYSPTIQGALYQQYFLLPEGTGRMRLAFDLLSFDTNYPPTVTAGLPQVTVTNFPREDLGPARIEAQFSPGAGTHWETVVAEPSLAAPDFEATGSALAIKGVQAGEPLPDRTVFGFWGTEDSHPDLPAIEEGRLYHVLFTVATDATEDLNEQLPVFRVRLNDTSLSSAALIHVESIDSSSFLPAAGSPAVYQVFYEGTAALAGRSLLMAFDYLWVKDVLPEDLNDPSLGLELRSVEVRSYPLP